MDIKLLVLDIDGTIAGKSNQVSERVKQAIADAMGKGIQVALATGRMYASALRFHTSVGSRLPLLAYNGAWIQNPASQEIERHFSVSTQRALELLDYFEQPEWEKWVEVHFYLDDRLYVRQITSETEDYADRSGIKPIAVGDLRNLLDREPTKILAISRDRQALQQISQNLCQRYLPDQLYLTQSTEHYFEATNPQANKGLAVRYLTESLLGLKAENVMAIGDNFNDLEMLQYAGIGVAMGSAPTAVRERAKWVAPDVEREGVAVAIEKFLF
ncbi:MAG: Cof-type HAD-IIB family hydrolase [Prochloraceae cyanobacterium]|nr:Cof-type HAD-IIB family hydrolase [Prochloraceae cyanobacterium]